MLLNVFPFYVYQIIVTNVNIKKKIYYNPLQIYREMKCTEGRLGARVEAAPLDVDGVGSECLNVDGRLVSDSCLEIAGVSSCREHR